MEYSKLSDRCRIILQVEKSFRDDFSFRDVASELERTGVFTADECRSVLQEATEEDQTEKMLFLLMYKSKKELTTFQDVLQLDYDWLTEAISQALDSNERFSAYEKCIRDSNIPNNRSGVIYRTDLLWQMRKELEKLEAGKYVVIHGNTGSGKRWLAIDACSDHCVIRAMKYKIFWLNVSDCTMPGKIINRMERLKVMLLASLADKELTEVEIRKNPYDSLEARMDAERNDLRAILNIESLKDALVVLCDLTNNLTQNAFDLHCKMLVTTRNLCSMAEVNEKRMKLISTNGGFTESECCCLFEQSLAPGSVGGNHLHGYFNEIHRTVNGNPDLLSKIAKNLRGTYDGNVEKRLKVWIQYLAEGVEDNRTRMVMEESLRVLDNEQAEMYRQLAIFPPNCLIPMPVLARYFRVNIIEVEEFVQKLEKYSLLEIDHVQTSPRETDLQMMARIQFICAQYLCRLVKEDLVQYHRNFVTNYNIFDGLRERREPNLLPFPNDHYFYTFIGYHLFQGEMYREFVEIFSDFGFLEVKIRKSGLNNTLCDVKMYVEGVPGRVPGMVPGSFPESDFFRDLPDFLTNVEGRIYQLMDLTLLQQALAASHHVRKQAWQQIHKYPDRVWFRMNCGENCRNIIQLCSSPKILRFLTPNSILVAQKDNKIVQTDLSDNNKYIPNVFSGHQTEIVQMEVFADTYLVSLDRSSVMYCWYVGRKEEEEENVTLIQNRRQFAGHTYYNVRDAYKLNPLHKIHDGKKWDIVCFHTLYDGRDHKLLCATSSGHILTYNWTGGQFVSSVSENFPTEIRNIKCIQYFGHMKILVLNADGKIMGFNLTNHHSIGFTHSLNDFTDTQGRERPIAFHFNVDKQLIYCVFAAKIMEIKIKFVHPEFVSIQFDQEIYRVNLDTSIECSALAKNGEFLVLGTTSGITVFDCNRRLEVIHKWISEQIACIDVFTSHEIIVIFGNDSRKNIANIFEIKMSTEPLSAVKYDLFATLDNTQLFVVDDAGHLRQYTIQSTVDIVEVMEEIPALPAQSITAITNYHKTIYLGCEDGSIYQLTNSRCTLLTGEMTSVEYLECVNGVLIIGTEETFRILGKDPHNGELVKCYAVNDEQLLMIRKSLNIEILHMANNEIISTFDCNSDLNLIFCDFAPPYLLTCGKEQSMTLHKVDGEGEIEKIMNLSRKNDNPPTSIALSADGNIFAIGFNSGDINVYDTSANFKLLHVMESHKSAVTQLKFSPWSGDQFPQILISLAEQICFWNVKFVLNNGGSSRNGELGQLSERINRLTVDRESGWVGKMGASFKPELLSCVKFVGNRARQVLCDEAFEKFITIDDEGEIYVLQLHDVPTFR